MLSKILLPFTLTLVFANAYPSTDYDKSYCNLLIRKAILYKDNWINFSNYKDGSVAFETKSDVSKNLIILSFPIVMLDTAKTYNYGIDKGIYKYCEQIDCKYMGFAIKQNTPMSFVILKCDGNGSIIIKNKKYSLTPGVDDLEYIYAEFISKHNKFYFDTLFHTFFVEKESGTFIWLKNEKKFVSLSTILDKYGSLNSFRRNVHQ